MPLDGQTTGGLTTDDGVGLGHLGRHPLKSDRYLVTGLPVGLGDTVKQVGRREVTHAGPLPSLVLQKVGVQQYEDLVGMQEMPLVINDTEAVCVTISGNADIGSTLDNLLGQSLEGSRIRRRKAPTKEGVATLVNGIDVATGRHKDGLEAGAGNAKHGVEDDLEVGVADGLQIDMIKDRVDVPVH